MSEIQTTPKYLCLCTSLSLVQQFKVRISDNATKSERLETEHYLEPQNPNQFAFQTFTVLTIQALISYTLVNANETLDMDPKFINDTND